MRDKILESFLDAQLAAGRALAESSDLLELIPLGSRHVDRYLARFACTGLVRDRDGTVREASSFEVGIHFPHDYLRRADPGRVLTWLGPANVFHPNIRAPMICAGPLPVGTGLVDLLYQVFEIITYTKVTMREDDALHHDACVWARSNLERFPVDRRPLKRALPAAITTPARGEDA